MDEWQRQQGPRPIVRLSFDVRMTQEDLMTLSAEQRQAVLDGVNVVIEATRVVAGPKEGQ